ncbi:MAG: FUSC family protein [Chthoniobacteraceae bacterium]
METSTTQGTGWKWLTAPWKELPPLAPYGLALGFGVRTMLACSLALFAAFLIQLDAPYWSALTVWIIANPHPVKTWGKGLFRITGTVIGASMAIVLISLFGQSPEWLLAALALWSGLCTGLACLLKNFHSYAAMLAGYTTLIVTVAVSGQPLHVFETAVARASAVTLGVMAVSLVSAVFHRDVSAESESTERFTFEPQYRAAFIGGFRALVAVAVTGQFWITSTSPTASGVMLLTGIMCGLFSTHPAPHHASLSFGLAIAASGLAAYLCLYYLVQRVETFPLFMLCLALFLIPGGMLMTFPRTSFFGLGFTVNFVNQVQPLNPMHYNLVTFLNNLSASMVAAVAAALTFLIIFPGVAVMIKEISLHGVYLAPLFATLAVSALAYLPIHWLWSRLHLERYVWHRPVFELAVHLLLLRFVFTLLTHL